MDDSCIISCVAIAVTEQCQGCIEKSIKNKSLRKEKNSNHF